MDEAGCSGEAGTGCQCSDNGYCSCGIPRDRYAGDVLVVEAGHPRLAPILERRFAVYDAALPSGEMLMQRPGFQRLVSGVVASGRPGLPEEDDEGDAIPGRKRRAVPA